ncbi:MAG: hypothetical protein V7776_15975 [Halopseudomonas aestusnigri]
MAPHTKSELYLHKTPISWLNLASNKNLPSTEEELVSNIKKGEIYTDFPIEAFVKMMGELATLNNAHPLWWATAVSVRNRVNSVTITQADNWIIISRIFSYAKKNHLEVIVTPNAPPLIARATALLANSLGIHTNYKPPTTIFRRSKQIAKLMKEALRSVKWIYKTKQIYRNHKISGAPTYLIRSFTYQSAFLNDDKYKDPFFGSLSDHLEKMGRNPVTIIQGFTDRLECYASISSAQKGTLVPFEIFQSIMDPFAQLTKILFSAVFRPLKYPQTLNLDRSHLPEPLQHLAKINWASLARVDLEEAIWTIQLPHLMTEAAGERIANSYNISCFITTCEANPWELMLTKGLRNNSTPFPILGYQHSVVPLAAICMFTSFEEQKLRPSPDNILTTGSAPAHILQYYGEGNKGRVLPACALRYEYLFKNPTEDDRHTPISNVLVALEGLMEVSDMVAYLIHEAPLNPNVTFAVRSHPVLSLEDILFCIGYKEALPSNVVTSALSTLEQDLVKCDAVLYWGTAVAIEALLYGKPLINFSKGGIFNYDPLAELNEFKLCTNVNTPLKDSINLIDSWQNKTFEYKKLTAQNYAREYFHPVTREAMTSFLS